MEGLSSSALTSLVATNCIERVAAVTCRALAYSQPGEDLKRYRTWPNVPPLNGSSRPRGGRLPVPDHKKRHCEWAPDFEDASVGLCMHLLRVRLIHCPCFQLAPGLQQTPCKCTKTHAKLPDSACPKLFATRYTADFLAGNVTIDAATGDVRRDGRSLASLIDGRSCEQEYFLAKRCSSPLSLHPVKQPVSYLAWWAFHDDRNETRPD